MGIPATIANAVQTTQTWLNELCDNGELADTSEAVAVLRSVLHQLRDHLTLKDAVDLSAQLSTLPPQQRAALEHDRGAAGSRHRRIDLETFPECRANGTCR